MMPILLLLVLLLTGCGHPPEVAEALTVGTTTEPTVCWEEHLQEIVPSTNYSVSYTLYGLSITAARFRDMQYAAVHSENDSFETAELPSGYFYTEGETWYQTFASDPISNWTGLINEFKLPTVMEDSEILFVEYDAENDWDWVTIDGESAALSRETGHLCYYDDMYVSFLTEYPVPYDVLMAAPITEVTSVGGYIVPVVSTYKGQEVDTPIPVTDIIVSGLKDNYRLHVVQGDDIRDIYRVGEDYYYSCSTCELLGINKHFYARTTDEEWGILSEEGGHPAPLMLHNYIDLGEITDMSLAFDSGDLKVYNATYKGNPATVMLDGDTNYLLRLESKDLIIDMEEVQEVPCDFELPTDRYFEGNLDF